MKSSLLAAGAAVPTLQGRRGGDQTLVAEGAPARHRLPDLVLERRQRRPRPVLHRRLRKGRMKVSERTATPAASRRPA